MRQLTARSIRAVTAGTTESNSENIRSALSRGLPEFFPAPCVHDGNMVIVGSGPSLPLFVNEIKAEREKGRPICSIKGAHDFLIDNGIHPDLFVSCEPRERPLKHVSPHTAYLVASRCDPGLFDQLAKARVVIWHSIASKHDSEVEPRLNMTWDDLDLVEECDVFKERVVKGLSFGVGGGATSGLRAITISYLMGFRNIHLYGFDSCLDKDKDTKRFSGEKVGKGMVIDVIVGGKRFWCNGALADQAVQFQKLLKHMPGLNVKSYGNGLIAAILEARGKR